MKRLVIFGLFFSCALNCVSLYGITQNPHPPIRENKSWFGAMEASLMTARVPNAQDWVAPSSDSDKSWLGWMGWLVAAVFLIVLAALHLRMRRQQKTMIRGGEPDFFFLPPARDRRRNQR